MNSEYRQKLLSLQGRLTCIQSELTDLKNYADKDLINPIHSKNDRWYFWDETWSSEIGPYDTYSLCREALDNYSKDLNRVSYPKTDYLPHDYLQGKGAVCRICGELKDHSVHSPKTETSIQRPHVFFPYDTHPNYCRICGYHRDHKLHTPVWKDITKNCTLVMRESTWPPEGRSYGTLDYRGKDIAHLVVDENQYTTPPGPNDSLIRGGAHLILQLVDKKEYRVLIQKRCWAIQRRVD